MRSHTTEIVEDNGEKFIIYYCNDTDAGVPWVTEDLPPRATYFTREREERDPDENPFHVNNDWLIYGARGSYLYYDPSLMHDHAINVWGVAPGDALTDITAHYERFRKYAQGHWWWMGIKLVRDGQNEEDCVCSLWGIESDVDADYKKEIITDLIARLRDTEAKENERVDAELKALLSDGTPHMLELLRKAYDMGAKKGN